MGIVPGSYAARLPDDRPDQALTASGDYVGDMAPIGHDPGAARDVGLWRGPSEARWIAQVLHGAPPPRDSALHVGGLVAHG